MTERLTTRLRRLISEDGLRVVPGVSDALLARLVAEAEFPIVYMSGAGTTAVRGKCEHGGDIEDDRRPSTAGAGARRP